MRCVNTHKSHRRSPLPSLSLCPASPILPPPHSYAFTRLPALAAGLRTAPFVERLPSSLPPDARGAVPPASVPLFPPFLVTTPLLPSRESARHAATSPSSPLPAPCAPCTPPLPLSFRPPVGAPLDRLRDASRPQNRHDKAQRRALNPTRTQRTQPRVLPPSRGGLPRPSPPPPPAPPRLHAVGRDELSRTPLARAATPRTREGRRSPGGDREAPNGSPKPHETESRLLEDLRTKTSPQRSILAAPQLGRSERLRARSRLALARRPPSDAPRPPLPRPLPRALGFSAAPRNSTLGRARSFRAPRTTSAVFQAPKAGMPLGPASSRGETHPGGPLRFAAIQTTTPLRAGRACRRGVERERRGGATAPRACSRAPARKDAIRHAALAIT